MLHDSKVEVNEPLWENRGVIRVVGDEEVAESNRKVFLDQLVIFNLKLIRP